MKLVIDISEEYYNTIIKGVSEREVVPIGWISIKNGTSLDSIIGDIEVARDKDKLCVYSYNRCIDIINKKVEAVKTCRTCFWESNDKYLYPCYECNRNYNPGYDKWDSKVDEDGE